MTGNVHLGRNFAASLVAEVGKFNEFARTGLDLDFNRGSLQYDVTIPGGPINEDSGLTPYPSADQPNVAMYPLAAEGPYYAFIVTASAVDTNGGPVISPDGQIVRWDGTPIEGLYGAGNCIANPSVNAYWGGGATIGSGHVWGYNAALHASASAEKAVARGRPASGVRLLPPAPVAVGKGSASHYGNGTGLPLSPREDRGKG